MKLLPFTSEELKRKLENYLDTDDDFKNVFKHTKERFEAAEELTAHNWEHAFRDTINAMVIGEAENADMRIVLPAACMHDIGFLYGAKGKDHGPVGADKLGDFLEGVDHTYTDFEMSEIAACIRTHKGSTHGIKPEGLSAQVVADADLMEKFGPFGVYQNIRTMTEFNRDFERSTERFSSMANLEMMTETGKKLAEPGRQFVIDFFTELIEAGSPYDYI